MIEKPSTYSPFFRRVFGNERSKEVREAEEHYALIKAHHDAYDETPTSFVEVIQSAFLEDIPDQVVPLFREAALRLAMSEEHIWNLPEPHFDRMTMAEFVEFRNVLHAKHYFFANKDELTDLLFNGIGWTLGGIGRELPTMERPSPFTIPLIYALPDAGELIDKLFNTFRDGFQRGLFRDVMDRLYRNFCEASGRDPNDENSKKPIISAADSTLPPRELAQAYLGGTPFFDIFMFPVPLKLTQEDRLSHMHVLAGSGVGKTVLIENLIRHDIESDDPPTIVLIDPHSDLVRKLTRSDLGISDRLILIDPRSTDPIALNPFAINRERIHNYDATMQEQVTAGVIQTFGYLFNGLTNLPLSGKQDMFFRYVARLLLSFPDTMDRNATILDMLNLMRDPAPYKDAIAALPDIPREFFQTDFSSKTFEGTREQIRYRLQAIIENPTMARLFTSPDTIDLFSLLNRPEGSIILVDTAKDFLKEGSAAFGKLIVSLLLQAIFERAAIPERERKPTFIFIDEASSFFSSNIDDLLSEARKYKAGLVLAHQYLDQGSSALRASLAANTAIKFASGLSASDASALAKDMRTTPEFILSQPKLQFAAHIRNVTPQAVSIPIRPVKNPPMLSDRSFENWQERNRRKVSPPPATSPPTPFTEEDALQFIREAHEAGHPLSEEEYRALKALVEARSGTAKADAKPSTEQGSWYDRNKKKNPPGDEGSGSDGGGFKEW